MPVPSIGSEISVDTSPSGVQRFPTVAATADGQFIIAWHEFATSNRYQAEHFNADGSIRAEPGFGFDLPASPSTTIENRIELAGYPTNTAGISRFEATSNDGDIFFHEYRGGNSFSMSTRVDQSGAEEHPFHIVDPRGLFFIGFTETYADTGRDVVLGTMHGDSIFERFSEPGDQIQSEGAFTNGQPVIVYHDVPSGNVMLRAVDFLGPDPVTAGAGSHPHVAALADGGVAVAWQGLAGDILIRVFDIHVNASGITTDVVARTDAVSVLPGFTGLSQSHVCALQDGRILVVWNDQDSGGGFFGNTVFGRMFNPDGTPDSGPFVIDDLVSDQQIATGAPRAAQLVDGRIVVTYADGLSSDPDIKAKILDPRLEGVAIAGTSFADDHVGTGFDDVFVEGAGNDSVVARGGADIVYGGSGRDTLRGDGGNDNLRGDIGNDTLGGGDGNDRELGGTGADQVFGNAGNDTLDGGAGGDSLTGGDGGDVLRGGLGLDTLDGGAGFDTADFTDKTSAVSVTLNGSASVNVLAGGPVEDRIAAIENIRGSSAGDTLRGDSLANFLAGGAGNDLLSGGAGKDTLNGGLGTDIASYFEKTAAVAVTLNGATLADVFVGGVAEDNIQNIEGLYGGTANDTLGGDSLANFFFGAAGADRLSGAAGNDTLIGSTGKDTLTGSAGADQFKFNAVADSAAGPATRDVIADFQVMIDDINLAAIDANANLAGKQNFTFKPGGFTGVAGQVISQAAATSFVYADLNGDRLADLTIELTGNKALSAGDFIFV